MTMMTAPIRESCGEFSAPCSSARIVLSPEQQHRRYSLCFLFLLSILSTSTSAYRTVTLPSSSSSTAAKSWHPSSRRTWSMLLHLSTPTNPSNNNNNNIIEDDEDAKIFAALSASSPASSSPAPILEEKEMMFTNTDAAYTGSVDWDAEWKAVMKKEANPSSLMNKKNRPGSDYYKSEAEIAAIRAANEVTKKATKLVSNVASSTSSMTDWNTIKYDWRVWIALLAVLSFGAAFVTAIPPSEPLASTESYFI